MNAQRSRFGMPATSAIAAATLAGGGGDSRSTQTPPTTMGTLAVSMTEAPACGFDAVTVNTVRVHQSASDTDAGLTGITLNPAMNINLLNLTWHRTAH